GEQANGRSILHDTKSGGLCHLRLRLSTYFIPQTAWLPREVSNKRQDCFIANKPHERNSGMRGGQRSRNRKRCHLASRVTALRFLVAALLIDFVSVLLDDIQASFLAKLLEKPFLEFGLVIGFLFEITEKVLRPGLVFPVEGKLRRLGALHQRHHI